VAHVLSLNLHRRHLTDSQLGRAGARLANATGGCRNQYTFCSVPKGTEQKVTSKEAADEVGVGGERTVKRGRKVLARGGQAHDSAPLSGPPQWATKFQKPMWPPGQL
jgi:hypothetical protein